MNKRTLERWLLRNAPGAERLELVHNGADATRVVTSFEAARFKDAQSMSDVVAEVLTAAQDESDLMDARASFVARIVGEADRTLASTPIRCEPQRDRGNEAAPDEPSKSGVVALLMEQNRFLHRIVADAPDKQRRVYEELIGLQGALLKQQRDELAELYRMLNNAGVEDAATRAERAAEEARRSEALDKALAGGLEIAKQIAANALGVVIDDDDETAPPGEPIQ